MKKNKNTMTSPELFVNDHHGQYMGQICWQYLADRYKKQAKRKLSVEDITAIEEGPENEWHYEAMDNFTNLTFKTETGQKLSIQYAEGGMWVIPACFSRTKAAQEFFEC